MIVSTITQNGRNLTCDIKDIPAQFSADLEFKFIKDEVYSEYVVTPYCAYSQTRFIEHKSALKGYPSVIKNNIFTVPFDLLKENGYLIIAFALSTDKETLQTLPIVYKIEASIFGGNILKNQSTWQELVMQTVDDRISLTFVKPMNELIDNAKKQQETITTQQEAINAVVTLINKKVEDGDFVPEHKWEGDILYFKNSDGTWDEGFKVPGLDSLNWKVATCTENATYQATIENWGTIENSLLAITFNSSFDKTKPVILKINDEEAHPIFSNTEAMLGEELENKSTILRFDGSKWLVQTSQSGTIQSSDKSVKDIVTVTREELNALQNNGQLVEGTLYQTVEPAEELNINKDAYMCLALQDADFIVSNTNKNLPIALSLTNFQGNCFSFSSGGVKIEKGITKVAVSASIRFSSIANNSNKFVMIFKNDLQVAIIGNPVSSPTAFNITEFVIDVKEGDIIRLYCYGESGDVVCSSTSFMTYLTVKAIEKDYTLGDVRALVKEITELKDYIAANKVESGVGYIKYPNGIVEQWGYAQIAENVEYRRVTFKIPHVADVAMTTTAGYFHERTVDVAIGLSNTYADIYVTGKDYGVTKERAFYWRSIGRWK